MVIKQRIIGTANHFFSRYGIKAITMDFLAKQLGISKKTIYDFFNDKDDLVLQCVNLRILEHKNQFREIVDNSTNIIAAVYEISLKSQEIYRQTNPLFYLDLERNYPSIYDQLTHKDKFSNDATIATIIEKGIREDLFIKNINTAIVNIFWQELISFIHHQNELPEGSYQKKELIENILYPFIRGLCTPKGIILFERHFLKNIKEPIS